MVYSCSGSDALFRIRFTLREGGKTGMSDLRRFLPSEYSDLHLYSWHWYSHQDSYTRVVGRLHLQLYTSLMIVLVHSPCPTLGKSRRWPSTPDIHRTALHLRLSEHILLRAAIQARCCLNVCTRTK